MALWMAAVGKGCEGECHSLKGGQIGVIQSFVWTLLMGEETSVNVNRRITQVRDKIDYTLSVNQTTPKSPVWMYPEPKMWSSLRRQLFERLWDWGWRWRLGPGKSGILAGDVQKQRQKSPGSRNPIQNPRSEFSTTSWLWSILMNLHICISHLHAQLSVCEFSKASVGESLPRSVKVRIEKGGLGPIFKLQSGAV